MTNNMAGIPVAAGTYLGLQIYDSYNRFGLSEGMVRELAAKFLGMNYSDGAISSQSLTYASRYVLPLAALYFIGDRKIVPKFVSAKTIQKNSMGLLTA